MDGGGLELLEVAGHARAVQLEGSFGLAACEHGEGFGVINGNVFNIDPDVARETHPLNRVREDGEVLDAEEVELEQAGVLNRMHVVLRDALVGVLGVELDRGPLHEGSRRDNDTCRMHTSVTDTALDTLCKIDDLPHIVVLVIELLQFRLELERMLNGHRESLGPERDELRDAIAGPVRVPERAGDVADGCARHECPEGADLRDFVLPVFLAGIRDHFVAPVIGEVHVDIRRLRTLRVEESLEGKLVEEGIDVRDTY